MKFEDIAKYTVYTEPNAYQQLKIAEGDGLAWSLDAFIEETHMDPRCKAIAKTKLQECIMWMNKGIYNAKFEGKDDAAQEG